MLGGNFSQGQINGINLWKIFFSLLILAVKQNKQKKNNFLGNLFDYRNKNVCNDFMYFPDLQFLYKLDLLWKLNELNMRIENVSELPRIMENGRQTLYDPCRTFLSIFSIFLLFFLSYNWKCINFYQKNEIKKENKMFFEKQKMGKPTTLV